MPGSPRVRRRLGQFETLETRCAFASDLTPPVSASASLSGRVWVEQTGNLRFDAGDRALAGVHLHLANSQKQIIATTRTDSTGAFRFSGLPAGEYHLREIQPSAIAQGAEMAGTAGGEVADDNAIRDIVLQAGEQASDYFFLEEPGETVTTLVVDDTPPLTTQGDIVPDNVPPAVVVSPSSSSPEVVATSNGSGAAGLAVLAFTFSEMAKPSGWSPAESSAALVPSNSAELPVVEQPLGQTPSTWLIGGGGRSATWQLSVVERPEIESAESGLTVSHSVGSSNALPSTALRHGVWFLPRLTDSKLTVEKVVFGLQGGTPVVGDFDADGESDLAMYADGEWLVHAPLAPGLAKYRALGRLGRASDWPIAGDWDGNGRTDIGVFSARSRELPKNRIASEKPVAGTTRNVAEPSRANVSAKSDLPATLVDRVLRYGAASDVPVVGDWMGKGVASVGVFQNGTWRLDTDGDGRSSATDAVFTFGQPGDQPVVGDFDGDGKEEVGIFRNGLWILDSNHNRQLDDYDYRLEFGQAGDQPVVGDWDGDGCDEPALYRSMSGSLAEAADALSELPTLRWLSGSE